MQSSGHSQTIHAFPREILCHELLLKDSTLLRALPFTVQSRQYSNTEVESFKCPVPILRLLLVHVITRTLSKVVNSHPDSWATVPFLPWWPSSRKYYCPFWNPEITKEIAGLNQMDCCERLKRLQLFSKKRRRERYTIVHFTCQTIMNGSAPSLGVRVYINSHNNTRHRSPCLRLITLLELFWNKICSSLEHPIQQGLTWKPRSSLKLL